MKHKATHIPLFIAGSFLALGLCSCSRNADKTEKPNVVCIVIDTLRADHLPMYGSQRNTAPFLDQLAKAGVVFNHTFAPSSWTAPSTASLFTSLYPFQHGVVTGMKAARDMDIELDRIPEEIETLGELFKRAGYRTYAVTDNLNISKEEGFTPGFDRFQNFHYEGAQCVNEQVLQWKKQITEQGTYFLYLHYMDPHGPLHERKPWYREEAGYAHPKLAAYDSEISYTDEHIRQLYEAMGWNSNTLMIITADHGQEFRDHGGFGHGKTLYAEVINIPLIVYSSRDALGFRAGRRDEHVSLIDILPTCAEVIGLTHATHSEGKSLIPLLRGNQEGLDRNALYSHLLKRPFSKEAYAAKRAKLQRKNNLDPRTLEDMKQGKEIYAIIQGPWKYLETSRRPKELYQITTDPGDQDNRAAEYPDKTSVLSSNMHHFVAHCTKYTSEKTTVTLTPEEKEHLKSLGYVR